MKIHKISYRCFQMKHLSSDELYFNAAQSGIIELYQEALMRTVQTEVIIISLHRLAG